MPRIPVENNDRMSLRIAAEEKSLLIRAAALQHTNLTEFVIRTAVANAKEVIELSERQDLSERDSMQVMDLHRGQFFTFLEVLPPATSVALELASLLH